MAWGQPIPSSFATVAQIDVSQGADWRDELVLVAGDPSAIGAAWCGVFDPAASYQPGDVVLYNGLFYAAGDEVADTVPTDPTWSPVMTAARLPLAAVNLTGAALQCVILPDDNYPVPIAVLPFGPSADIAIVDAVNGAMAWQVAQAVVASWPVGCWRYILRLLKDGDYVDLMRGPFLVHPRPF